MSLEALDNELRRRFGARPVRRAEVEILERKLKVLHREIAKARRDSLVSVALAVGALLYMVLS